MTLQHVYLSHPTLCRKFNVILIVPGELRELDLYSYAWLYPAEIKGDDETFLVIDATKRGNTLRFANDGGANSNCKAVYLSVKCVLRMGECSLVGS
jgi:hypothetical protein